MQYNKVKIMKDGFLFSSLSYEKINGRLDGIYHLRYINGSKFQ